MVPKFNSEIDVQNERGGGGREGLGWSMAVWEMLKWNCTIGTGRFPLYLDSINIVSIALDRICSFWCRAILRVPSIHSKLFTFLTFIWRFCAGGCSLAAMKCILKPEGLRSSGLLLHLNRIGILLCVLFYVLWGSVPPKSMPISSLTVFWPLSSQPCHPLTSYHQRGWVLSLSWSK